MDHLVLSRKLFREAAISCLLASCGLLHAADSQQITPGLTPADTVLNSPSAVELERKGDLFRAEKRYLDSVDLYTEALAKHPSATLWNKEGMAYLFLQRYHDSQKCFDNAIKLDKSAPEAYNNRGFIEQHKKNYGKALKYYRKALLLRPDSADFHYNIATVYFDKHDFQNSAREYRQAYELDNGIFDRHARTGVLVRASSPDDRAAFAFMVAKMYAQNGDFDRSLLYLRKAMEDGYKDFKKVYSEPEFATLRTDKRFSELMSQKPQAIP